MNEALEYARWYLVFVCFMGLALLALSMED